MQPKKKPARSAWLRRGILTGLLIVAALLAARMQSETVEAPDSPPASLSPVADRRSMRETAYKADLAALQALMEDGDEALRRQAGEQIARMTDEHQQELGVEEAMMQAGLPVRMALMQNGALTVIVPPGPITQESSAAILALCAAHTDAGLENIRLMEAED